MFAFGIWFFLLRNTEPSYDGKPLNVWVRLYARGDLPQRREAAVAIREIGTNALPFLVEEICVQYSGWRLGLARFMEHAPAWLQNYRTLNDLAFSVSRRGRDAANAFGALGPAAAAAVPRLGPLARNSTRFEVRIRALKALRYGGPTAMPVITNILANDDQLGWTLRVELDAALEMQGTNAISAIPILLAQIRGSNPVIRELGFNTLGILHLDAPHVVPALIDNLKDPSPQIRLAAIKSLRQFGSRATNAVPMLDKLRNDPDMGVRSDANLAISAIVEATPGFYE